jgi:hypothetical protein
LGFVARLSGASQFPPNDSQAIGTARVMIDLVLFTMRVQVDFQGLAGATTAATIHGNTAVPGEGQADAATQLPSLPAFPLAVAAGAYERTINLAVASSYNLAYIAANGGTVSAASNALFGGLATGRTYFKLSTTAFGAGEISGFLFPTPPADFNFDGVVGSPDLTVWAEFFAVEHHGDASGDGFTSGDDFLLWQRQLGAVAGLGGGHGHGIVPAPEPRTAASAAAGWLALLACRSWGKHKKWSEIPGQNRQESSCMGGAPRP